LITAVETALSQTTLPGSATVCVVQLHKDGILESFNLGDSGFVIIRRYLEFQGLTSMLSLLRHHEPIERFQVIKASCPMMHDEEENVPFQIGSSDCSSDMPSEADVCFTQMKIGDLVIVASDGLWDNLSRDQILACVQREPMENEASPKKLAWRLVAKAQKEYDIVDDITCVVGQVVLS
jgi:protein phosphatase PTC7